MVEQNHYQCIVKHCRKEAEVIFLGKPVCHEHWHRHCDDNDKFDIEKQGKKEEQHKL